MSPVVPRQSNICTLGPIGTAGWMYTFVSRELCAAYVVCAVVIEPDITAAIARTMPILRISFLPVCWEFAVETVRRAHAVFEAFAKCRQWLRSLVRRLLRPLLAIRRNKRHKSRMMAR